MMAAAPWVLCAAMAVWVWARGLRIKTLRAMVNLSDHLEAKANEERIAAEAHADVLGRKVGEWSKVAAENDARAGHIAAKAAELAGERDRLREEVIAVEARYRLLSDSLAARRREAVELRTDRERHAEALAEQVEECDHLTAALAERDRRWIGAIRSERPKHPPSGAVARALDGVERAVRGGE